MRYCHREAYIMCHAQYLRRFLILIFNFSLGTIPTDSWVVCVCVCVCPAGPHIAVAHVVCARSVHKNRNISSLRRRRISISFTTWMYEQDDTYYYYYYTADIDVVHSGNGEAYYNILPDMHIKRLYQRI